MRSSSIVTVAVSLLLAVACGGGGGGKTATGPANPGTTGAGSMSATIDGSAWTAVAVTTGITNGVRIISGSDLARSVAMSFLVTGTGTQQFSTSVALGVVIIGLQSWDASSSNGATGSVTITTLTSNRAVGTFSFTAKASTASTTPATRQVTNGKFDVKF